LQEKLPDSASRAGGGAPRSRRAAIIGLIVAVLLIVTGMVLIKVLGEAGRLQDCELSGRTNCAPIDSEN
jgi:hypothetical protein